MDLMPLLAGTLVVLYLVRHLAVRHVAAGHGKWVWLLFGPTLFIGIVILWAAGKSLVDSPVLGLVLTIGGVLFLVSVVVMIDSAARGVSAAKTSDDVEVALTTPLTDFMLRQVGAVLLCGLIAVVVLVVYGVYRVVNG